jgi:hypothetical protein
MTEHRDPAAVDAHETRRKSDADRNVKTTTPPEQKFHYFMTDDYATPGTNPERLRRPTEVPTVYLNFPTLL